MESTKKSINATIQSLCNLITDKSEKSSDKTTAIDLSEVVNATANFIKAAEKYID